MAKEAGATDVEIHDTVLIAASLLHVQPLRGRAGHMGLAEKEKFMEIGGKMAKGYMEPYVPGADL